MRRVEWCFEKMVSCFRQVENENANLNERLIIMKILRMIFSSVILLWLFLKLGSKLKNNIMCVIIYFAEQNNRDLNYYNKN